MLTLQGHNQYVCRLKALFMHESFNNNAEGGRLTYQPGPVFIQNVQLCLSEIILAKGSHANHCFRT